jgi:uncharacterized protein
VSTPIEPAGPKEFADYTLSDAAPPPITPDNPPWGVLGGGGLWLASVVLMIICPLVFLIPYLFQRRVQAQEWGRVAISDPTAIFLQIVSTVPAHLLTLGAAWLIVTRVGRRPFFRGLGWGRGTGLGLLLSAVLAVGLLVLGITIIYLTGNPETTLDKMLKTSRGAALATAFLATFTAPLVEEVVYRGVLYSGLRKYLGAAWAGLLVVVLFALVHVPQYIESPGTIAVILLLSAVLTVIRAYTGQLFYCFVVHTVFNGIQSVFIVAEPYLKSLSPDTPTVPAPDPALLLRLLGLF